MLDFCQAKQMSFGSDNFPCLASLPLCTKLIRRFGGLQILRLVDFVDGGTPCLEDGALNPKEFKAGWDW